VPRCCGFDETEQEQETRQAIGILGGRVHRFQYSDQKDSSIAGSWSEQGGEVSVRHQHERKHRPERRHRQEYREIPTQKQEDDLSWSCCR